MKLKPLLVTRKQLRDLGVCLSNTQIDRLEAKKRFPARIKLGPYRESRVVWRYKQVLKWIAQRARETKPLNEDDFC